MEKTTWENPSSDWSTSRNFSFLADKKIDGVQSNYSQKHQTRLKNRLVSKKIQALDAFVKTPRKDREIACVVNKETLTREIVEKLFQSVQLGLADTTNPSQLQKTVWF